MGAKTSQGAFGDPDQRWTAAIAHRALAAWKSSGLSASAFAREHGLNAQRISWWSKRLGEIDRTQLERSSEKTAKFVAARVVGLATASSAAVVVRVRSEIVLEVDPGAVAPEWLASLLAQLARA